MVGVVPIEWTANLQTLLGRAEQDILAVAVRVTSAISIPSPIKYHQVPI